MSTILSNVKTTNSFINGNFTLPSSGTGYVAGNGSVNSYSQFITSSGSFTVPSTAITPLCTIFAAGGGGANSSDGGLGFLAAAGGAGSGGSVLCNLPLAPGVTYNFVIGTGGLGATAQGNNGANGTDSSISANGDSITIAHGNGGSGTPGGNGGLGNTAPSTAFGGFAIKGSDGSKGGSSFGAAGTTLPCGWLGYVPAKNLAVMATGGASYQHGASDLTPNVPNSGGGGMGIGSGYFVPAEYINGSNGGALITWS